MEQKHNFWLFSVTSVTSAGLCLHVWTILAEPATPIHFSSCFSNTRQRKYTSRPASHTSSQSDSQKPAGLVGTTCCEHHGYRPPGGQTFPVNEQLVFWALQTTRSLLWQFNFSAVVKTAIDNTSTNQPGRALRKLDLCTLKPEFHIIFTCDKILFIYLDFFQPFKNKILLACLPNKNRQWTGFDQQAIVYWPLVIEMVYFLCFFHERKMNLEDNITF